MRSMILFGVAAMAGLVASQSAPANIHSASEGRLSAAWGGATACFKTNLDSPCPAGSTCVAAGPGVWVSQVFTGQGRASCVGGGLAVTCTPNTPKLCMTGTTCTDAKCTTCDPPITTNVNSNTNLGDPCPPPPPPVSSGITTAVIK